MRRFLKRVGWTLLWMVTAAAVVVALENWRGARAWNAYVHAATAKGSPPDVFPGLPPPANPEENLGSLPLFRPLCEYDLGPATENFPAGQPIWRHPAERERLLGIHPIGGKTENPKREGELTDMAAWVALLRAARQAEPPEPGRAPGELMLAELASYESELGPLRVAIDRPRAYFPYRRQPVVLMNVPEHWAVLLAISKIVRARALACLSLGRGEQARDECIFGLKLANALREEPIPISHAARTVLANQCIQVIWEGIARRSWNDAQLAELQNAVAQVDSIAACKLFLQAERAVDGSLIAGPYPLWRWLRDRQSPLPALVDRVPGWMDFNRLHVAQVMDRWISAVDVPARRIDIAESKRIAAEVCGHAWNPHQVWLNSFFAIAPFIETFGRTQDQLNVARCALGIERYRLAHGESPERLEQLVPAFLPRVPHSAITGEPVRYRRKVAGPFELWMHSELGAAAGEGPTLGDTVWEAEASP